MGKSVASWFKLKPWSIVAINLLFVVILAGIALDYFGQTYIVENQNTFILLVILAVLGLEAGVFSLMDDLKSGLTTNTIGKIFLAIVFLGMVLVILPPLAGMVVLTGEIAGTIVTLGVVFAFLLSFV